MGKVFGLIHTIIIGFIVLTGNDVYDWVLGGIIAVLGYIYSFRFVGKTAYLVGYNAVLMSLIHWICRTVIVALVILVTRSVYMSLVFLTENEILSVVICILTTIVVTEVLKATTKLNKKYWRF